MRYRIRKGEQILATVDADSASEALDLYVADEIPEEDAGGGNWRARDFLKYQLSVERLSYKPTERQFNLWQLLLAATVLAILLSCLIPGGLGDQILDLLIP